MKIDKTPVYFDKLSAFGQTLSICGTRPSWRSQNKHDDKTQDKSTGSVGNASD